MGVFTMAAYNSDQWQEIQERKPGVKILARISGTPTIAYFKYRANDDVGPVNGNEFIAYQLAEKVGLPVPKTDFLKFGERLGTVSFMVPGDANLWSVFPHKNALEYSLAEFGELGLLVVFDLWIYNIDRHQDNLMYSKIAGEEKYRFFAIDHGHSLYGASKSPPVNFGDFNLDNLVRIQEFRELFSKGFDFFGHYVEKVAGIKDYDIVEIVNSVPREFMGDGEKKVVIDMLIQRQKALPEVLQSFCSK